MECSVVVEQEEASRVDSSMCSCAKYKPVCHVRLDHALLFGKDKEIQRSAL